MIDWTNDSPIRDPQYEAHTPSAYVREKYKAAMDAHAALLIQFSAREQWWQRYDQRNEKITKLRILSIALATAMFADLIAGALYFPSLRGAWWAFVNISPALLFIVGAVMATRARNALEEEQRRDIG